MAKNKDKTKYIYVFSDIDNPMMVKVGDAYDIIKRFDGETRTASAVFGRYRLWKIWEAKDRDGNDFRDHAVHEVLRNSGYLNVNSNRKRLDTDEKIVQSLLESEFSMEKNSLESKAGKEWFMIDTDDGDIEAAVAVVDKAVNAVKEGRTIILKEKYSFSMRDEQRACCEQTANYIKSHESDGAPTRFLWNCKMRFGKTFTAYQLALAMGWKRILVLTFKPVVIDSWRTDLLNHKDFDDWQFIDKDTANEDIITDKKTVAFYSFQYLMTGNDSNKTMTHKDVEKGAKTRNKIVEAIGGEWDCVILDEYHFGAWRHISKLLKSDYISQEEKQELKNIQDENEQFDEENNDLSARFSIEGLRKAGFNSHNYLYLSGTPFRAMTTGEFGAEQIYSWTYLDEQKKKVEEYEKHSEKYKQYEWLPNVDLYTYEIHGNVKSYIRDNDENKFDLNAFFQAKAIDDPLGNKQYKFMNDKNEDTEETIKDWLDGLYKRGRTLNEKENKCYPLSYMEKKHLVWFLPSVASCKAMNALLNKHTIGHSYDVICCAGDEAGIGYDALRPVKGKIGLARCHNKGSITLTCGKLLTGVTIPQWEGIFMLCNCKSTENYLQAAFRVQSPWEKGHKKSCVIFDFAPVRAIRMVYKMSIQSGRHPKVGMQDYRGYITEFLKYMPILAYENNGMKSMRVDDIMNTIANITTTKDIHKQWGMGNLFNSMDILDVLKANHKLFGKIKTLGLPSEGPKKHATFGDESEVEINRPGDIEVNPPTRHRQADTTGTSGDDPSKDSQAEQQRAALEAKLKFIAERLRIYMYLTDFPEKQSIDIFNPTEKYKKDCDEMFKLSMGYLGDGGVQFTIDDLHEICNLGIINEEEFNLAVHSFYDMEEKEFRRMGIDRLQQKTHD